MSDKTEKQAITKAEFVKAMKVIREWCKNRDTLEDRDVNCPCIVDCPMYKSCIHGLQPCEWEVEE